MSTFYHQFKLTNEFSPSVLFIFIKDTLVEIGIILYTMGDMNGALSSFKEAFHMYGRDRTRSSDIGLSKVLNNIGCIYFALNKWDESLRYLEKAHALQRMTLGLNVKAESAILNCALTLSNIGHIKLKQYMSDAVAPLEESLLVRLRISVI